MEMALSTVDIVAYNQRISDDIASLIENHQLGVAIPEWHCTGKLVL